MGSKPTSRVEALLYELCVGYGYCLSPDEEAALLTEPPGDVESFVDAVLLAYGQHPHATDRQIRADLSEIVRQWLFDDGRGKGSKSGLPRLPTPNG